MSNGRESGKQKELIDSFGPWQTPGYLMIIGGADRLDSEARIQKLFLQLVRRAEENSGLRGIVLISTATRHPELLTGEYLRILARLGVRENVYAPLIRTREEARREDYSHLITNAAGIFITGGDQYTLTQTLDRTPVEEAIMDAYGKGAVIAGTSAGATAMGRPMIVAGGGNGELRLGMVQMSDGLAWAGDDLIIDTHFGTRGRFPRLASAVAQHPAALGVGIDENTCLITGHDGKCVVAGTGVVYFLDASRSAINTATGAHYGQPLTVGALDVNILAAGAQFDLQTRKVILAADSGKAAEAAEAAHNV